MPQPYNVFTIYAREDARLLSELLSQLKPLEISGRIKVWSDREINPGVQWEQEIVGHLDSADIILILVSPAYYNSEYIHRVEIKRAVERHQHGEAKVLPIIVRPCAFEDDPLVNSLQVLPTDGKAVTDHDHWSSQDKAWLDVINGVKRTLNEFREVENRREQKQAVRLPYPLLRYITIGGGALALLLAIWLLPKMFRGKEGEAAQSQVVQPDSTLKTPAVLDNFNKDSTPVQPIQMEKPSEQKTIPSEKERNQPSAVNNPSLAIHFNYPMVRVSGGTFSMGSNDSFAESDECPHTVIVKSFSIGKYEVTQAQWEAVMGDKPSLFKGCNDCPVENVSWNDVQRFIKKLNIVTGKRYRLPTEAEWEFAARGGNKDQNYRFAGSDDPKIVAWYSVNSENKPHPVGGKMANELGLYDMSGNVFEWCLDAYGPYPCDSKKTGFSGIVSKGGAWYSYPKSCRPSYRVGDSSDLKSRGGGFRLAQ